MPESFRRLRKQYDFLPEEPVIKLPSGQETQENFPKSLGTNLILYSAVRDRSLAEGNFLSETIANEAHPYAAFIRDQASKNPIETAANIALELDPVKLRKVLESARKTLNRDQAYGKPVFVMNGDQKCSVTNASDQDEGMITAYRQALFNGLCAIDRNPGWENFRFTLQAYPEGNPKLHDATIATLSSFYVFDLLTPSINQYSQLSLDGQRSVNNINSALSGETNRSGNEPPPTITVQPLHLY